MMVRQARRTDLPALPVPPPEACQKAQPPAAVATSHHPKPTQRQRLDGQEPRQSKGRATAPAPLPEPGLGEDYSPTDDARWAEDNARPTRWEPQTNGTAPARRITPALPRPPPGLRREDSVATPETRAFAPVSSPAQSPSLGILAERRRALAWVAVGRSLLMAWLT